MPCFRETFSNIVWSSGKAFPAATIVVKRISSGLLVGFMIGFMKPAHIQWYDMSARTRRYIYRWHIITLILLEGNGVVGAVRSFSCEKRQCFQSTQHCCQLGSSYNHEKHLMAGHIYCLETLIDTGILHNKNCQIHIDMYKLRLNNADWLVAAV